MGGSGAAGLNLLHRLRELQPYRTQQVRRSFQSQDQWRDGLLVVSSAMEAGSGLEPASASEYVRRDIGQHPSV